MLRPEKAEIIGLLCSEGCHFVHKWKCMIYYKNRGKHYLRRGTTERIEFSNTNKKLLERFQSLFLSAYQTRVNIKFRPNSDNKILIIKKVLMNDLLKYSDYGWKKWRVPKELFKSNTTTKTAFIRGLYEGDGTKLQWRGKQPYLEFHMKNLTGLRQVKRLLKSLGIDSLIYVKIWKLMIKGFKDVQQFADIVRPEFRVIDITRG